MRPISPLPLKSYQTSSRAILSGRLPDVLKRPRGQNFRKAITDRWASWPTVMSLDRRRLTLRRSSRRRRIIARSRSGSTRLGG